MSFKKDKEAQMLHADLQSRPFLANVFFFSVRDIAVECLIFGVWAAKCCIVSLRIRRLLVERISLIYRLSLRFFLEAWTVLMHKPILRC